MGRLRDRAIAGVLVVESVAFWDRRRIDDPVGAISVHGICGFWGVIAVGLFADGTYGVGWNGVDGGVKGLLYGDASQLVRSSSGSPRSSYGRSASRTCSSRSSTGSRGSA